MFFDLSASGDVKYDMARYDLDEAARQILESERDEIRKEGYGFDDAFGMIEDKFEVEE
jgi:hypothetical protein